MILLRSYVRVSMFLIFFNKPQNPKTPLHQSYIEMDKESLLNYYKILFNNHLAEFSLLDQNNMSIMALYHSPSFLEFNI